MCVDEEKNVVDYSTLICHNIRLQVGKVKIKMNYV